MSYDANGGVGGGGGAPVLPEPSDPESILRKQPMAPTAPMGKPLPNAYPQPQVPLTKEQLEQRELEQKQVEAKQQQDSWLARIGQMQQQSALDAQKWNQEAMNHNQTLYRLKTGQDMPAGYDPMTGAPATGMAAGSGPHTFRFDESPDPKGLGSAKPMDYGGDHDKAFQQWVNGKKGAGEDLAAGQEKDREAALKKYGLSEEEKSEAEKSGAGLKEVPSSLKGESGGKGGGGGMGSLGSIDLSKISGVKGAAPDLGPEMRVRPRGATHPWESNDAYFSTSDEKEKKDKKPQAKSAPSDSEFNSLQASLNYADQAHDQGHTTPNPYVDVDALLRQAQEEQAKQNLPASTQQAIAQSDAIKKQVTDQLSMRSAYAPDRGGLSPLIAQSSTKSTPYGETAAAPRPAPKAVALAPSAPSVPSSQGLGMAPSPTLSQRPNFPMYIQRGEQWSPYTANPNRLELADANASDTKEKENKVRQEAFNEGKIVAQAAEDKKFQRPVSYEGETYMVDKRVPMDLDMLEAVDAERKKKFADAYLKLNGPKSPQDIDAAYAHEKARKSMINALLQKTVHPGLASGLIANKFATPENHNRASPENMWTPEGQPYGRPEPINPDAMAMDVYDDAHNKVGTRDFTPAEILANRAYVKKLQSRTMEMEPDTIIPGRYQVNDNAPVRAINEAGRPVKLTGKPITERQMATALGHPVDKPIMRDPSKKWRENIEGTETEPQDYLDPEAQKRWEAAANKESPEALTDKDKAEQNKRWVDSYAAINNQIALENKLGANRGKFNKFKEVDGGFLRDKVAPPQLLNNEFYYHRGAQPPPAAPDLVASKVETPEQEKERARRLVEDWNERFMRMLPPSEGGK